MLRLLVVVAGAVVVVVALRADRAAERGEQPVLHFLLLYPRQPHTHMPLGLMAQEVLAEAEIM